MIIVTGTIAYDYIMDFPGAFADHILPEQLHKINLSFIVSKFDKRRGGTAGNLSYSLGLLKTPHKLFSYAGKDFAEYKKTFEKLQIDTTEVKIDRDNFTSTGFAMADKTHNQIWGYFYGASDKIPTLKLSKIAKKGDVVFVGPSGAAGSMGFINQCIEQNLEYMFDPAFILTQVTPEDLKKGLLHASYVLGNDYEIKLMESVVPSWTENNKNQIVVKTLGAQGAVIFDHGKEIKIKPCKASKVVDPTGAGDAWRAGFLAGLDKGFDLKTSGQMGAVAGAYAVENYGGQEHAYTVAEFKKRYLKTYGHLIHL
ncbi:MAG: hypothetical protein KA035_01155 [Candidatus Levybacteria bacterium]|nr:hypothetical protein [Candidatus Levybacteria bacterium]